MIRTGAKQLLIPSKFIKDTFKRLRICDNKIELIEVTIYPSDWHTVGTFGQPGFGFALNVEMNLENQFVVSDSRIFIYLLNGGSWTPLPLTLSNDSEEIHYVYKQNGLCFQIEKYDSDKVTIEPKESITLKIIVMEGNTTVAKTDLLTYQDLAPFMIGN